LARTRKILPRGGKARRQIHSLLEVRACVFKFRPLGVEDPAQIEEPGLPGIPRQGLIQLAGRILLVAVLDCGLNRFGRSLDIRILAPQKRHGTEKRC
jgi:hypothetical protein